MSFSRRQFVKASVLAVGAAMSPLSSYARAGHANERVRMAVIGVLGRGGSHLAAFNKHVTAICDCDQQILAQRADAFDKEHGTTVARYVDYRKLLESTDIDAVSIATPNHTHAIISIEAAQAGKDVYVEKPSSHNVWESHQIVNAARKYDRIIQIGTQSRSNKAIRQAVQFVHDGKIGTIQYVICTGYKPRKSIGKLTQPLKIPSHIDYDLWCGPAAKVDLYRPKLHYDWHWDFNTGAGDMGNSGVHDIDVARWILGEAGLPRRVMSIGGRVGYEDAADTPNTEVTFFDYDTAPLIFETRGLPKSKEAQKKDWPHMMDRYRDTQMGLVAQCEQGYVSYSHDRAVRAFDNDGHMIHEFGDRWDDDYTHFTNFIQGVRSRKPSDLNAEIIEGHVSSSLCHLGQISYRTGRRATASEISEVVSSQPLLADSFDRMADHLRANEIDIDGNALTLGPWLEIDSENEMITNNPQAAQLLTREFRKPYVVPELSV